MLLFEIAKSEERKIRRSYILFAKQQQFEFA